MCNLHCITLFALVFLVLHIFTLVLHILHSFLSQSELSNFFVYIINVVTGRFCSTAPAQREQRVEVGPPNLTGSFAHAQYVWQRCWLLGALRDALRFSQVHAVHSEACLHYRLSDQRYQKTGGWAVKRARPSKKVMQWTGTLLRNVACFRLRSGLEMWFLR